MRYWHWFWTACFLVAGLSFALIALVVAVRGVGDLRDMFAAIRARKDEQ